MFRLLARSAVLAAALLCLRAQADPILSLQPTVQAGPSEPQLILDLMIAGLKDPDPATVLGGFDVKLAFDPTTLSLESVDFDQFLGGTGATFDQVDVDRSVPAATSVRLFSVSLLEVSDSACFFCTGPYLADLQGSSFRLAQLRFTWHIAQNVPASVGFAGATLADGFGANIPVAALIPAQVEIPEPATPALFGLGVALLGALHQRGRHNARTQGALS